MISASVYIASFEFFKGLIVERVHGFFTNGPDGPDDDGAAEYEEAVRSLNKSVVYASLAWLQGLGAIDETDIDTFTRVKRFRNTLAHELFSMVVEQGMPEDFDERFAEMVELLNKIEVC